jgi:hypothetical protein
VRGAVAREQDLPIAGYDDLGVKDINSRLPSLPDVDLSTAGIRAQAQEAQDHPAEDREPSLRRD